MSTSTSIHQSLSRRQLLRRAVMLSGGLAVASALGACAGAVATPRERPTVRMAISTGATEFLWTVLKARKIDEKHGFIAAVNFLDPTAANQAVFTGQVDAGSSQPIPVVTANNSGRSVTFFAPTLWNHNLGVTYADAPGRALQDFIGKRLATLPPLSGTYTSTQVIAAELGLNFEKDFHLITAPPEGVLAFLQRRDVDGIIHFEPFISNLMLTGRYRVFLESNTVWRELTGSDMLLAGIAAQQSWLDRNRDLAKRITAAVLETGRVIREDPRVFDEHGSVLGLDSAEKIQVAKERLPQFFPTQWDAATVASTKRLLDRALALGIVERLPNREIIAVL